MSYPLNKWVSDFNGVFSKERIQIDNTYCMFLTPLLIRKSQAKSDFNFYPTIGRMAIINKTNDNN